MAVGAYDSVKGKAARASCAANLRGLYTATTSFVEEQGHWPQISTQDIKKPAYAEAWVGALSKYGIASRNWICSSVQLALRGHDFVAYPRVDYLGMPFGPEPRAAYQWPNQPWFVERGDMHGDGNLLILTNGRLLSLEEFRRDARSMAEQ